MKVLHGVILSAFLVSGAALPVSAQAVNSQCPVYPAQTHAQILRGVEGRLDGNWDLAIQTTNRSIKRLKDKGKDSSEAELFVTVLTCLRDEVKSGQHAEAVQAARAAGKPEPVQSGQTGSSAPAAETPVTAPVTQSAATAPAPVEAPAPAPAPSDAANVSIDAPAGGQYSGLIDGPAPVTTSALPGTAESYGEAPAPAQPAPAQPAPAQPAEQLAAAPASGDYTGQACVYFTRPYEETVNGVRHVNRYNEGEWACHAGTMYACSSGAWEKKGACTAFNRWETRLTTTVEATPR